MRLDDFDPDSVRIEDQRGGRMGLPMGGGGKLGCGSIVIILIAAWACRWAAAASWAAAPSSSS